MMPNNNPVQDIYVNKNIERYCKSLTRDWEELRSEMIMQLLKMKVEKMQAAVDGGYIEYICMTICKRIFYGNSSGKGGVSGTGIFYNYKREMVVGIEEGWGWDIEDKSKTEVDAIGKIEEIINRKHWYEKTLFNYHYKSGYKLREIAELTGINLKSVAYTISKVRKEIKKELEYGNWN